MNAPCILPKMDVSIIASTYKIKYKFLYIWEKRILRWTHLAIDISGFSMNWISFFAVDISLNTQRREREKIIQCLPFNHFHTDWNCELDIHSTNFFFSNNTIPYSYPYENIWQFFLCVFSFTFFFSNSSVSSACVPLEYWRKLHDGILTDITFCILYVIFKWQPTYWRGGTQKYLNSQFVSLKWEDEGYNIYVFFFCLLYATAL